MCSCSDLVTLTGCDAPLGARDGTSFARRERRPDPRSPADGYRSSGSFANARAMMTSSNQGRAYGTSSDAFGAGNSRWAWVKSTAIPVVRNPAGQSLKQHTLQGIHVRASVSPFTF